MIQFNQKGENIMNIKENKNFKNVSLYTLPISTEELKKAGKTFHMNNRDKRLNKVLKIEKEITINKLIKTLLISKKGIINFRVFYENTTHILITYKII